ncbi:lipopolysaccharide transport periplasmic protein LptA [Shewanella glacialimarina]|jgi:lipopolysaccharide export system protein LptA|uniref:lipopolysaccharide transport periplasmic protein LptA n=1 Tax=Shewanella glacialimarina TaxID=2590884 RepID=UPI001CF8E73D|nr:lipopolysaccharide transport periplasmic protein LptA [Shewanella glacialimarina]UCX06055.1 lipopolysaccharide transport periplasmic protein LptA [Shewanella glacialimarina]
MNHINFLTTLLGKSSVICTLAISILAGNAVAKEGDLKQELKIAAVSQRADVKNNQIIFNGPVKITQGSINIEADELRAFSAENGQTKTLIATGNPATFSQELDDGRIGTASANEIRYDLATTGLLLTGNAKLDQAGSKVTGNVIRYNINAQELIAESTGKGEDRVITIIQPENFQNDNSPVQKLPEIPLKKQGNQ